MNLKYELSNLAILDLEDIWKYTAKNWSISQANSYYRLFYNKIDEICKHPNIGKSIEQLKKEHRIVKVKSHLIIYKIKNETIFVDRILHQRMDIKTRIRK